MRRRIIFVDFNNSDTKGRLRLNLDGTIESLKKENVKLENGLELIFDDECELQINGVVEYSECESIWVAKIDWNKLKTLRTQ